MRQIAVTAFVDWNSQIYNAGATNLEPEKCARLTLETLAQTIQRAIESFSSSQRERFTVSLRLYSGWHRGLRPTENRMVLRKIVNTDFPLGNGNTKVRFEPNLHFGERLLEALPHRLTRQSGSRGMPKIHLPDTYRKPLETGKRGREKMVDTALACDVIVHARSDAKDWRLILAEDDDLVPALFVAEAWSKDSGGRTILVRKRCESQYLSLDGLVWRYE